MNWREKRLEDINVSLMKATTLLGDYESKLLYIDDPQESGRIKQKISELQEKIRDYKDDLSGINTGVNVKRDLALRMSSVTHEELDFVITALLNQRVPLNESNANFKNTDPQVKMTKNNLTGQIKFLLDMGLAKSEEVRHFIENTAKFNFPDIPERLKASLNEEYNRLESLGITGDELFNELYDFTSGQSTTPSRQAAGLAVLCYFFETCEIFVP